MICFSGIVARISVIWHKILHPKHNVRWRTEADELCSGDITCETCNKCFWCRIYDDSDKVRQKKMEQYVDSIRSSEDKEIS